MKIKFNITAEYDFDRDTIYINLCESVKSITSTAQIDERTLVDLDDKQNIVGIEILQFTKTRKRNEILNTDNPFKTRID